MKINHPKLAAIVAERRPPGPPGRFRLISFKDLKPSTALAYCIKGIFPRVGVAVVWGPPKCGKSFWTMDAMLHVSLGWEYRGRKVTKGRVVYCAFEGQDGYGARGEGFRQHHAERLPEDEADIPFSLMPARIDLIKEHPQLIQEVREQLGDDKPAAIVLDTLNRSLNGSETDDMGAYVRAADALREAFDCLVIIVHHCGVEGTRPRGHTSLTGAADAQVAVKRNAAGNVVATVEWMKDGPEGAEVISRLTPITIGQNDDGDDVTTCLVEAVEGEAEPNADTGPRLTANQKTMFSILHRAGQGGLAVEDWNEQARQAGLGVKRRPDLYDFRDALRSKGLAHEYNGRWYVRQ